VVGVSGEQVRATVLVPVLALVAVIVAWEAAVAALRFPPQVLPAPSLVLETLWKARAPILEHAAITLVRTLIGFGLAIVVGVGLGLVIGYWWLVSAALSPLVTAFYCLPKAAVVPIFLLWVGLGTRPAVLTALSIAFFPILVNVVTGLSTIDPDMADLFRTLGGRRRQVFWKVGLPASLPYFFASLRVAGPSALVGAVIAEMFASSNGLGYVMLLAGSGFNMELMFATVVMMAALGGLIYLVCAYADRRFAWWAYRMK
jgi:NitT/TauT family transport system permease protein